MDFVTERTHTHSSYFPSFNDVQRVSIWVSKNSTVEIRKWDRKNGQLVSTG